MSDRQNAYLKAMGIDIWVERNPSVQDVGINVSAEPVVTVTDSQFSPVIKIAESLAKDDSVATFDDHAENKIPPAPSIASLSWPELQTAVAQCTNCELSRTRAKVLLGSGAKNTPLMIIGDAPTAEDEQRGEPFSGEAGKLLNAMLKAMGYKRNDVYISNVIKCRTANGQELSVDEAAACEDYLVRQVNLIQPKMILALGSVTAQRLLKSKSTMARLRGQLHYLDNINIPVIVSYHPAYLLVSPNEKRKAWEDLQMAMKYLAAEKSL